MRVVDVAKHLYTPESTLTDQLKFSLIKKRVPGKTDQMRYKICENKCKKRVMHPSFIVRMTSSISSNLLVTPNQKLFCYVRRVFCFQCQLTKAAGLRF